MVTRIKALAVVAAMGSAALAPAYGAPSSAPLHPEWARMILHGLGLEEGVLQSAPSAELFSVLSWKNSLAVKAESYLHRVGVELTGPPGARRVVAVETEGEVSYPIAVARGGDYRVRVRLAGEGGRPIQGEILRHGDTQPATAFRLASGSGPGWLDAGPAHLDAGAYTAVLRLPRGTGLERLEIAPPCVSAIEPLGGWNAAAVTTSEDVAVTTVKAIDAESELPSSGPPIEVPATEFRGETATTLSGAGLGREAGGFKGRPGGTRAHVTLALPAPGLYTISVLGTGGQGQVWLADACRKAVVCPSAVGTVRPPHWRVLMTAPFTAGPHYLSVMLGDGASVSALRAERKKADVGDYVTTVRRLGLDVGVPGPTSRDRAIKAMRFIEGRRAPLLESVCGGAIAMAALPAGREQPATVAGRPGAPAGAGLGVPLGLSSPGPPGASPEPPAASPSPPPIAPTPSPIPCLPPGSAVEPSPCPSP